MPWTFSATSSKPAFGTAHDSMPRSAPKNTTSSATPLSRASSATANPGNKCPPVPPPAIATFIKGTGTFLIPQCFRAWPQKCTWSHFNSSTFSQLARQREKQAADRQEGHDRRAAVADERKADALGRKQTEHDADVDHRLQHDDQGQPGREKLRE